MLKIMKKLRKKIALAVEKESITRIVPVSFANVRRLEGKKIVILPIEKHGCLVLNDCEPDFHLISYSFDDFSENVPEEDYFSGLKAAKHLSFATEFFGQSLRNIIEHLTKHEEFDLVLILNGDVMTSVSEINRCLFLASTHSLDVFQPSLSIDSFYSHQHLLNKPGAFLEEVPFTEVMMLGLSSRVVSALYKEDEFTISGWGIDNILLPYLLQKNSWSQPHVIHASIARHCKPVESGARVFSNGKSAREEYEELSKKYNRG